MYRVRNYDGMVSCIACSMLENVLSQYTDALYLPYGIYHAHKSSTENSCPPYVTMSLFTDMSLACGFMDRKCFIALFSVEASE